MSWKPLKQLKKWTVGSAFGFKKASPLNPFTHGIWTTKKVYNGFKKGTALNNIAKLYGMKLPNSSADVFAQTSGGVYGHTGSIVGRY